VRVVILSLLVAAAATAWVVLIARARRRNPNWSPKRDLAILGVTAAVTAFLAVPIAPKHHHPQLSVGQRVVLWTAVWLVLASVIRLLTLVRRPHVDGRE
jgi:hypothetical protein